MSYRIRVIATDDRLNPWLETYEYHGEDIDLKVKELAREFLFGHGFKKLNIKIACINSQRIEHVRETLKISIN